MLCLHAPERARAHGQARLRWPPDSRRGIRKASCAARRVVSAITLLSSPDLVVRRTARSRRQDRAGGWSSRSRRSSCGGVFPRRAGSGAGRRDRERRSLLPGGQDVGAARPSGPITIRTSAISRPDSGQQRRRRQTRVVETAARRGRGGIADQGDRLVCRSARRRSVGRDRGRYASAMYRTMTGEPPRSPPSRAAGRIDATDAMAGDEGDGVGDVAMGHRDAGIGEPADAGGDAGHDPEGNARCGERCASSPPRPNTKGSPPLRRSTRSRPRASSIRRG